MLTHAKQLRSDKLKDSEESSTDFFSETSAHNDKCFSLSFCVCICSESLSLSLCMCIIICLYELSWVTEILNVVSHIVLWAVAFSLY